MGAVRAGATIAPFPPGQVQGMATRRDFILGGAALAAALAIPGRLRAAPRPLTILVLGGSGFLGPHFVDAALAAGHRLTLFNRGKRNPTRFDGQQYSGLEQLRGDRRSDLSALEGDRRWDAVLDTSAYFPADVRRSAGLLASRVGRYMLISSISAYADHATPGADETAPVAVLAGAETATEITGENYGPLKALCEQAAEQALPGRSIVVRPGLIVGPGDTTDRFTYWPVRAARGGEVLAPGAPDDPIQCIDVRDLAAFLLRLIEQDVAGTFNADAPPGTLTMGGLLDASLQAAGEASGLRCIRAPCLPPDTPVTWVPADFLKAQGVSPWSDLPVWMPAAGENAGWGRRSTARAQAAGLRCRPLHDTARDTLTWWNALPEARRATLQAGLSEARERGVLQAWHARQTAGGNG